jgi:type IV secretory pathway TrbF-like protein
VVEVAETG